MSVLASGSTGNATYVESEKGSLLVDVGLTGKKMENLFSQIDRDMKNLNGILVTHEHSIILKDWASLHVDMVYPYANEKRGKRLRKDDKIPMIKNLFSIRMKRNPLQVLI